MTPSTPTAQTPACHCKTSALAFRWSWQSHLLRGVSNRDVRLPALTSYRSDVRAESTLLGMTLYFVPRTPTTPQEPVCYPGTTSSGMSLRGACSPPARPTERRLVLAISAYARRLPCCQRHLMTIAEIATTGEEQVRRSRNDIKPMCHCKERALRPHVRPMISGDCRNLSPCKEPPLLPKAPDDYR